MSDTITNEDLQDKQTQAQAQSQYMLLDMDRVIENPRNPNKMDATEYAHLKANLDATGWNKNWPVIVRTHPSLANKYEIIDGAHRYKAMKELGFEEIVCTLDEWTTPESMIKTLGYNKHRWQNDSILLSGMIHDLLTTHWYTYADIEEVLGYTEDELKGIDMTSEFDLSKYESEDPVIPDIKPEKVVLQDTFKITLSAKQMDELKLLLKNIWIKDKTTAVLACLKYFNDQPVTLKEKDELVVWAESLKEEWLTINTDDDAVNALLSDL